MTRWLRLCLPLMIATSVLGERGTLTVIDFASWTYQCDFSDYGNTLDLNLAYSASMMTPPGGDPQLCEFPEDLVGTFENQTSTSQLSRPVALLVSLGGCEVRTKALVALEIHQKISSNVKYIVFYNNDPNDYEQIVVIPPPEDDTVLPAALNSITFISISTGAGTSLMSRIEQLSHMMGANPEFLGPGNDQWYLPMLLNGPPSSTIGPSYGSVRVTGGNFYWFRFVLFALLIVSPCCRACYLWWAGGGRIQFRRSESGWIIGLQYIPPVTYWFASNGVQESGSPVSNRLTEEQVLSLPQVVYKAPEESERNVEDVVLTKTQDKQILVSSGSADIVDEKNVTVTATNTVTTEMDVPSPTEVVKGDEEQPIEAKVPYTTRCTACSICIEDFEEGERIRILPRCMHAFHTDCLMPWLTERQGCCPLCKTRVLEDGGEEQTTEADGTLSLMDSTTEHGSVGVAVSSHDGSRPPDDEVAPPVVESSNAPVTVPEVQNGELEQDVTVISNKDSDQQAGNELATNGVGEEESRIENANKEDVSSDDENISANDEECSSNKMPSSNAESPSLSDSDDQDR